MRVVNDTVGANPDEVLLDLLVATNSKKYDEVAGARIAAGQQADAAASLLKEFAKDILAADPFLEMFLTDIMPEGGNTMVVQF